jgi:hypothetical protein
VAAVDKQLANRAPLARGLAAWASERFPIAETAAMLLGLYVVSLLYGRALVDRGRLSFSLADAGAFAAVWSFFLMIRVIDEHKDYERDLVDHPDRVLQRGVVTLAQLRALGVAAIGVQLAVSLSLDGGIGPVTIWWLIAIAFVALTTRELFIGEWLNRRLLAYVMAHLPLWSLAVVWIAQIGARPRWLPLDAIWLALLGFALPWGVDLARRIAPATVQRPPVSTSYADSLGARRSALVLTFVVLAGAVTAGAMLTAISAGALAADVVLAVATLPALAAAWRFGREPMTQASRSLVELTTRLALAVELATVGITLVAVRGLT